MIALAVGAPVAKLRALAARTIPSRVLPFTPTSRWTPCARTPAQRRGPAGPVLRPHRAAADERRAMLAPTLVIGHRRDPIHPLTDAGMLADELPNGRLLEANSFVELRLTPDRLTGEIAAFLDACWKPTRRSGRRRRPATAVLRRSPASPLLSSRMSSRQEEKEQRKRNACSARRPPRPPPSASACCSYRRRRRRCAIIAGVVFAVGAVEAGGGERRHRRREPHGGREDGRLRVPRLSRRGPRPLRRQAPGGRLQDQSADVGNPQPEARGRRPLRRGQRARDRQLGAHARARAHPDAVQARDAGQRRRAAHDVLQRGRRPQRRRLPQRPHAEQHRR